MVGAFAGNRVGAIRDAKGKSVAAVFSQLGGQQKAEVSTDDLVFENSKLNTDLRMTLIRFCELWR